MYVDGTSGNDANDGSSFGDKAVKTFTKALQIQAANKSVATIYVKGSLSLSATANVPSGVTLSVASKGATISGSGSSVDGIVLKSGSTRTVAGKLTMTGFKTALTSEKGSTITDGTYVLKGNAGKSGTCGIYLAGTVRCTSWDRLTITTDDKSNTDFYASGVTFENCTVNVTSQARTWFDAFDLNLKNASLTVRGFGQTFYVNKLNMDGSDLTINPSTYGGTGVTIQGSSNIVNSHVTTNAGSTAGISVGAEDGTVNVANSTLEFNNGGTGGLNVNTGMVVLANSTIKGNADNGAGLFGAQASGSIVFGENCLVETPAKSNADNGAGQTGRNFVVTGGSYLVKYATGYNSSYGSTFSKDSVFKKNPDVFAISTDKSGGEVATVKSSPKVSDKKTLDGLLKSLSNGKVSASTEGIASSTDTDSNAVYTGIATYKYHVLRNEKVTTGWWIFTQTDYFYWFDDPAGTSHATFKGGDVLSQDVTYYLKWDDDPAVEKLALRHCIHLQGDHHAFRRRRSPEETQGHGHWSWQLLRGQGRLRRRPSGNRRLRPQGPVLQLPGA